MKSKLTAALLCISVLFSVSAQTDPSAEVEVLKHALSPNDSERNRPLLDALDFGFNNVEVDLWLVEGSLLIGKTRGDTSLDRTLEAIYLKPLKARTEIHAGKVYPDAPPFTLILNFHSDAALSYAALKNEIEPFQDMLTRFTNTSTAARGVTLIVSGNTPREMIRSERTRHVGIEGKINDLNESLNPNLIPMIGDDWNYWFRWDGEIPMNEEQRERLKQAVEVAHYYKTKVRFLNAPDSPFTSYEFHRAGVDLISSTDFEELQDFLKRTYQRERSLEVFRKANEELQQKLTP